MSADEARVAEKNEKKNKRKRKKKKKVVDAAAMKAYKSAALVGRGSNIGGNNDTNTSSGSSSSSSVPSGSHSNNQDRHGGSTTNVSSGWEELLRQDAPMVEEEFQRRELLNGTLGGNAVRVNVTAEQHIGRSNNGQKKSSPVEDSVPGTEDAELVKESLGEMQESLDDLRQHLSYEETPIARSLVPPTHPTSVDQGWVDIPPPPPPPSPPLSMANSKSEDQSVWHLQSVEEAQIDRAIEQSIVQQNKIHQNESNDYAGYDRNNMDGNQRLDFLIMNGLAHLEADFELAGISIHQILRFGEAELADEELGLEPVDQKKLAGAIAKVLQNAGGGASIATSRHLDAMRPPKLDNESLEEMVQAQQPSSGALSPSALAIRSAMSEITSDTHTRSSETNAKSEEGTMQKDPPEEIDTHEWQGPGTEKLASDYMRLRGRLTSLREQLRLLESAGPPRKLTPPRQQAKHSHVAKMVSRRTSTSGLPLVSVQVDSMHAHEGSPLPEQNMILRPGENRSLDSSVGVETSLVIENEDSHHVQENDAGDDMDEGKELSSLQSEVASLLTALSAEQDMNAELAPKLAQAQAERTRCLEQLKDKDSEMLVLRRELATCRREMGKHQASKDDELGKLQSEIIRLRGAVRAAEATRDSATESQQSAEISAAKDRAIAAELRGQLQAERDRNARTVEALRRTVESLRVKRIQDAAETKDSWRRIETASMNTLAVQALIEAQETTEDALRVLNKRVTDTHNDEEGHIEQEEEEEEEEEEMLESTKDSESSDRTHLQNHVEKEMEDLREQLRLAEKRAKIAEDRLQEEYEEVVKFVQEQRLLDPAERYLDDASKTIADLTQALEQERQQAGELLRENEAQGQQIELLLRSARENKGKKGFHASRLSGYWDGRGESGWQGDVQKLQMATAKGNHKNKTSSSSEAQQASMSSNDSDGH